MLTRKFISLNISFILELCREKADHMIGDLLKDTMFSDSQKDLSGDENEITEPAVTLKAPAARKDHHEYEDISKFDAIFQTKPEFTEEKKASVVRLRNKDNSEESKRQKFYRRLSFSSKDKTKTNLNLRKSREAEDYESFHQQAGDIENQNTHHKTSTTSQPSQPLPDQHSFTPKTSLTNLFGLTRRGSRRDSPKGEIDWIKPVRF